jgi:coproporphyrinogen III oxidase
LQQWAPLQPVPQDQLLQALIDVLPAGDPAPVSEAAKQALAQVSRDHYRRHPQALNLQASGDVVPPTVANHRP